MINKYFLKISYINRAIQARGKSQLFLDFVTAVAVIFGVFQLLQAIVVTQSSITSYVIHVLGTIVVVCLVSIGKLVTSSNPSPYRLIFQSIIFILVVTSCLYLLANSNRLDVESPWISNIDILIGFLLFFAVVSATWIEWGPVLSLVGVIGILYFLFGHHLPGLFGYPWESLDYVISYLGMSLKSGMFWLVPLSMNIFFPLMVFGLVLRSTGATDAFSEIIKAASMISKVAPVYVCVVESGLVGTVTGSSSANVVLTGSATIPAMRKIGLSGKTAAGLEALASTGSQLVPPIMGLAAFIMAQIIGVSYIVVMKAAIIPAILYYGGLVITAYFSAMNELGEKRVGSVDIQVEWSRIFRLLPTFVIPLGGIIWLLAIGYSPLYASALGIIGTVILSQLQGKFRPSFGEIARGFSKGAILGSQIAAILMCIGFLGQALISTGLGVRLSRVFGMIMAGNLYLALVVLMVVSLIVGMGAPTIVAYILVSISVVPALQGLGIEVLVAHFFAFYFAAFSHITPPVAPAVVAASRLAGTDFMPTAWHAVKISWPLFLVPFFIVFHQDVLTFSEISLDTTLAIFVFIVVVINGVASVFRGIPKLDIGVIRCGILAISAISGIGYIFSGMNVYLAVLLVMSLVGWGTPLLRRLILRRKY